MQLIYVKQGIADRFARLKINDYFCSIMRIAIIGAGAAGCFCAIHLKRLIPDAEVVVYEAGKRPLAKVAITGGGRCNLTNSFVGIKSLKQVYPRGEKLMKKLFCEWNHSQTMQWFEQEGVRLVTQPDECVFPQSQDAMQIVNTLINCMKNNGVKLHTSHRARAITPCEDGYMIRFDETGSSEAFYDKVVVAIGGTPSARQLSLLDALQVEIAPPVPSLFTFNINDKALHELMGCVVENVTTSLAGTKFQGEGPLLVTHWGMSGPAILKLSSRGARYLAECNYHSTLCINWMGDTNEEEVRQMISDIQHRHAQKLAGNEYPSNLTGRLWVFLLQRSGIGEQTRWCELTGKRLNKLISTLTADSYDIEGKSRCKEEFVTCGGVALSNLRGTSMELRQHPGVYLAGEVLDVDAITGGFNLQAAWTMGYAVATNIAKSCTSE